jgi:two-component system response regulator DctR
MVEQAVTVVLIEDDPMVQAVNRKYIEQLKGFKIVGTAANGIEGINIIRELTPDLAIIDVFMPNQDGLETLKQLRAEGYKTDIIMVTAASDLETVKYTLQHGAIDYILKPFTFERIQQAFENYLSLQRNFKENKEVTQTELDQLLFQIDRKKSHTLPKGLTADTLERITLLLKSKQTSFSADEVAESIGVSRVTSRRYLEYLVQVEIAQVKLEYSQIGRPKNRYYIM